MYYSKALNGSDLPLKTLCLTFDDGPGIYTLPIARLLYKNQIRATFFVVGKYAFHHPDILKELKEMNHLVGNHTYDHPDMPGYLSVDGNVVDQVLRTDAVIKPFVDSDVIYFRPPYGKWSREVANELNQSILTANHLGPIHWEVAGVDCYFWQNEWSVADAAARYTADIEQQGKGIVVLHDDVSDMDVVKEKNHTLELLEILIPQLLQKGYQFVRLDEIASIKEASAKASYFTLYDQKGRYVFLKNQFLFAKGKVGAAENLLQCKDLGHGKIAIKAMNNCYLSTAGETDTLIVDKSEIQATETFDLIPVNSRKIMLRCSNGNFLTLDKKQQLNSSAKYMRQATIFRYANHNAAIANKVTFKQNLLLIKRMALYIKSKLQAKLAS